MTEEPAATRRLTGPPVFMKTGTAAKFILQQSCFYLFHYSDFFQFFRFFRFPLFPPNIPKIFRTEKRHRRADSFFTSLCFRFPGAFLAVGKRPPAPPNGSFPDRYRLLC